MLLMWMMSEGRWMVDPTCSVLSLGAELTFKRKLQEAAFSSGEGFPDQVSCPVQVVVHTLPQRSGRHCLGGPERDAVAGRCCGRDLWQGLVAAWVGAFWEMNL